MSERASKPRLPAPKWKSMVDEQQPQVLTKTVPDPSTLTTEQLLREIDRAISLFKSELRGDRDSNSTRFDGIDREFMLIEDRRKEQKLDTKTAVDAALNAAEKAVKEQTLAAEKSILKSETSGAEQSKQQYATFTANLKAVTDNVSDLKDRVGKIEAIKLGAVEHHTSAREQTLDMRAVMVAAITIIFTMMTIGLTLFAMTRP